MNEKQRKTLLTTAAIIALMVIFPPYEAKNKYKVITNTGYGFLFDLPVFSSGHSSSIASIDAKTLLIQIFGALVVGGLVFVSRKEECRHP